MLQKVLFSIEQFLFLQRHFRTIAIYSTDVEFVLEINTSEEKEEEDKNNEYTGPKEELFLRSATSINYDYEH